MARIARLVVPRIPHHVTQRGNRRERTFFGDADYRLYRDWLGIAAAKAGADIWAYCLMPNHVHAVVTPKDEEGLWRTFGDLHRRTTGHINARNRWTGHLWQARFGSAAMDEDQVPSTTNSGNMELEVDEKDSFSLMACAGTSRR